MPANAGIFCDQVVFLLIVFQGIFWLSVLCKFALIPVFRNYLVLAGLAIIATSVSAT